MNRIPSSMQPPSYQSLYGEGTPPSYEESQGAANFPTPPPSPSGTSTSDKPIQPTPYIPTCLDPYVKLLQSMRHLATSTPHKAPISSRTALFIERILETSEYYITKLSTDYATFKEAEKTLEQAQESTSSQQDINQAQTRYLAAYQAYQHQIQTVDNYQETLITSTIMVRSSLFKEGVISPEICHAHRYEKYIDCTPEEKLPSYETVYIGLKVEEKIDAMNATTGTQQTED